VREQLEHDRVIRLLQAKYKRKFEVAINPGNEQSAPVGPPGAPWYPDLVLQSAKKLLGVVEVETAESLNNLEAMSQWTAFSKLRVPFHLYVPAAGVDSARRLASDLQIDVAEMWAYHAIGEQIRFTLVSRSATAPVERPREPVAPPPPAPAKPKVARAAAAAPARPARRPTPSAPPPKARPVAKKKAPVARKAVKRPAARPSASSRPTKRK
jgi:hypothetical protein